VFEDAEGVENAALMTVRGTMRPYGSSPSDRSISWTPTRGMGGHWRQELVEARGPVGNPGAKTATAS
jgi:hypothetical protein